MPVTERGDSPEVGRPDFGFRKLIVHLVDCQESIGCLSLVENYIQDRNVNWEHCCTYQCYVTVRDGARGLAFSITACRMYRGMEPAGESRRQHPAADWREGVG